VRRQKVPKTGTTEFLNKSKFYRIPFRFNMESVPTTVNTFLRWIQSVRVSRALSEWRTFSGPGHVFAHIYLSFPFQISAFTTVFLSKDGGAICPPADGRKGRGATTRLSRKPSDSATYRIYREDSKTFLLDRLTILWDKQRYRHVAYFLF
jgi:hypothetical protein